MKKPTLRTIVAAITILLVYNLVVFVVPFAKNPVFWISWVTTLLAFCVTGASLYFSMDRAASTRSRFYGFPIARIGVIYGIAQLIAGFVCMIIGPWIPWWPVVLVFAAGFGAAVLGLIATETVVDQIQQQDFLLKKDTALMRNLQSKTQELAGLCDDSNAAAAMKAFAEELRFSDPVSAEALAESEANLANLVALLQDAVADGDAAAVQQLCRRATAVLAERNRLCKLHKN